MHSSLRYRHPTTKAVAHRARAPRDTPRSASARARRGTAIPIRAGVPRGQKRRHGVCVCVVQLDAVESGEPGSTCGRGEDAWQHRRQIAHVRQMQIGDALAIAEPQRLELRGGQHALQLDVSCGHQPRPHVIVGRRRIAQLFTMPVGDLEIASDELALLGPPADREEVDDLDEEPGAPAARAPNHVDELARARGQTGHGRCAAAARSAYRARRWLRQRSRPDGPARTVRTSREPPA